MKILKLKILLMGHQCRNFGTYWRLWFLARGLVKAGHAVTLATVSRNAHWKPEISVLDGVTLWEGPNLLHDLPGQGTGPLDILGRVRLIQRSEFDVIHGFEFFPNIRFPLAWTRAGEKSLILSDWCDWYSHGGLGPTWGKYVWLQQWIEKQEDAIRRRAHAVTVISQGLKKRTIGLGIPEENCLYLPGGAPVDVIKPEDQAQSRQRWGIDLGTKVLMFMGSNQGDLDMVVEAFVHVHQEVPDSLLLLAGARNPVIMQRVNELHLTPAVRETGPFDYQDLSSLLGCADVFALPLRDTEANQTRWPNKIGEYMSAGRPTVTQPVGEMIDLFQKYAIGVTAHPDRVSFGHAIVTLLKDQEKSRAMGREARRVAETIFAWEQLSRNLAGFYTRLLDARA